MSLAALQAGLSRCSSPPRDPDRVRSLILTGTALDLFPPDHITAAVRERVSVLEAQGAEAAYETHPNGAVTSMEELWRKKDAEARGHPEEFLKFQRRLTTRAEGLPRAVRVRLFATELRNLQAYLDLSLATYAQRIVAPALVLHGSDDHVVPLSWGEALGRAIPRAEWVVVPGTRHAFGPMNVYGNERSRLSASRARAGRIVRVGVVVRSHL
ncbi:MAG: alpha/beta fold hydrolase [bacterium]